MKLTETSIEEAIAALDVRLFEGIPSQTQPTDRTSLLAIQRGLRQAGSYVYLEIGSHLGGTIQPHYADPRCRRIYSIDKRPTRQPDERGTLCVYDGNSTEVMRGNLRGVFPGVAENKLVTFDADASEMDPAAILEAPDFCFIDGEHTNAAVVSDFRFCLAVAKPDAIIAMHDSGVTIEGIRKIQQELSEREIPFAGMKLGGSTYAFALGTGVERWRRELSPFCQDEELYFRGAAFYRRRLRREARWQKRPILLAVYRTGCAFKDWLYRNLYLRMRPGGRAERND